VASQVSQANGRMRKICSLQTETKVLKQLVRDKIDPTRDLGHSDKHGKKKEEKTEANDQGHTQVQKTSEGDVSVKRNPDGTICEDCT
jgi:hypothetical protein